jgi:hypothetical protein
MSTIPAHIIRRPYRNLTAAIMAVLYVVILLSPLAPFAVHFAGTDRAIVRQCSGDCNICGCSPESRASHTCCCAKKRMLQNQAQLHDHNDGEDDEPECCKKERAENKKTVIACGCPCGNGKQAALSVNGTSEILPFHFTETFTIPHSATLYSPLTHRLTSRLTEPPDPPPKLTFSS